MSAYCYRNSIVNKDEYKFYQKTGRAVLRRKWWKLSMRNSDVGPSRLNEETKDVTKALR